MAGSGTRLGLIAACAVIASAASAEESENYGFNWDAGPVYKRDGWELKVGGRVQLDYSFVHATISNVDWRDTELRRLRLGFAGKAGDRVKYKVEFNTNSTGDVNLEDGYVQWAPTGDKWNVKAGQFKTPNSLDEQTSSRFISTLERAAFTDAFEFNRRLGVAINASGDKYTLSAGIFGDNVNFAGSLHSYALAARGTVTPIKTEDLLVHLGASIRYRSMGTGQRNIRDRQRPFSHITGRIISTGSIADGDLFVGGEAAAIYNNFWLAGEYGATFADCSAAAMASMACVSDPTLQGGYAEAGIVFGGKKTYKGGKFNRPKVNNPITKGGMGAVSFVARFDTIDLTDAGVNGGSYNSYILGADWWATKYTRLGVNFFKVDAELGSSTSGLDSAFVALITGAITTEEVRGVTLRAQLDF